MAANLRDPGSIPGGDPKRFQDSSNYVFYIVGECFSSAADTHLATDLTCKYYSFHEDCPIFARHRWCNKLDGVTEKKTYIHACKN